MILGKKISWYLEGFGGGFMKLDKEISWNLEGFGGFMKRWRPRSIGAKRRSTGRHREIQPLGCENLGGTPNKSVQI